VVNHTKKYSNSVSYTNEIMGMLTYYLLIEDRANEGSSMRFINGSIVTDQVTA
jgi:hypothetical protein